MYKRQEQRFVCADSLDQYHLQTEQLIISAEKIDRTLLTGPSANSAGVRAVSYTHLTLPAAFA